MKDEMDICAAAYFRGKGKDVATTEEFVMDVSLPAMMDAAAAMGMQRRDFIQSCNKIQKRLDIEVAVAALIVLRDAGADVGRYLDAVYSHVKAA